MHFIFFLKKEIKINYVLNILSPWILQNALNSYSMACGGKYWVAKQIYVFWTSNNTDQFNKKINHFLYLAWCLKCVDYITKGWLANKKLPTRAKSTWSQQQIVPLKSLFELACSKYCAAICYVMLRHAYQWYHWTTYIFLATSYKNYAYTWGPSDIVNCN